MPRYTTEPPASTTIDTAYALSRGFEQSGAWYCRGIDGNKNIISGVAATLSVGITTGSTAAGTAFLFDGTTSYLEFATSGTPADYTIEAKVYCSTPVAAGMIILHGIAGNSSASYGSIYLGSSGLPAASVFDGSPESVSSDNGSTHPAIASDGLPYHVVGVVDTSTATKTLKIYVDGTLYNTATIGTPASGGSSWFVGRSLNTIASWAGKVAWAAYRPVALTASEISDTFANPYSVFTPAGGDTTAPVVASANVNSAGTTLTIAFTETGSAPVLPASSVTGFTLSASGGPVTLSSTAISSTTFTATTSRTIGSTETLSLAYSGGNVTDSAGTPNSLASFSGTSVTNNSTQVSPLAAGTVSFDSSGPAGGSAFIKMTATDATGGTPTFSYQWQRNTDGGSNSNLSNGSGVSGATTRTVTDGSATSGHLYGYRLVYTDSAGTPATATSGAVTAQVYGGGSLTGGSTPFIGISPFIRGVC